MASPKIEAVIREPHQMAECPVWEEETGQLLYVDISAGSVCCWDPPSGAVHTVSLRGPVGCMALHHRGTYVVAMGTCLGLLDWTTGAVQWLAQVDKDKPNNRFNDGKVDPAGRFVADGSMVRQLEGLGISNGLDWSLDHRTLYHVDSLDYTVRAYNYDLQTGAIANPRLLLQLQKEDGMPDGMCVDTEGRLWVACIDGGRIIHLDPETGTVLQTVDMPVSRVTSCCFGGPHYSDLYVTSASEGLSAEQLCQEPQAGCIFKVTGLGAKGLPSQPFAG